MELTQILVVSDMDRALPFYRDVLEAEVVREYGGTSVVLRYLDTWLLLVTGGGPTPDKPKLYFEPPSGDKVSHAMTIRVDDCHSSYAALVEKGAEFLTPPVEYEWEIRAFFTDPDGHLFEISEAREPRS